MNITLELPQGAPPPKLTGTLTGPPDDLRIEIRLADFVAALGQAQAKGAAVSMVPHGVLIDTPPPSPTFKPLKVEPQPKPAAAKKARKATAAQKRWNNTQDPLPLKPAEPEAAAPPAAEYVPSEGSVPQAVLKTLTKKPASSIELCEQLPACTPASIYKACQYMRDKGLLTQEISEHDGTRRWKLVARG